MNNWEAVFLLSSGRVYRQPLEGDYLKTVADQVELYESPGEYDSWKDYLVNYWLQNDSPSIRFPGDFFLVIANVESIQFFEITEDGINSDPAQDELDEKVGESFR